ncbi:MAG: glycosyltransferase family 1 protein [Rhodocyclaceae bacterium]|nr:MAG: glycosyltransferase family 1 protein [Rhodocyclaceae bacterium]
MRIAYDHQIFGWQEYGGISRYFYELAREMATTCGQQVKIIAPLYVNRYLDKAPDELQVFGTLSPYVPKSGRFYRFLNALIAAPLLQHFRPDIVHETYYASAGVAPRDAKVVLTVFDMIHERFKESVSAFDPVSREKIRAVKRADHVICISEQTRRDLLELIDINPAKTSVVYLGFSLIAAASRQTCNITIPRPFLLYVGKRGGYKNFEGLLKAYAASSLLRAEFDLVCLGGGGITSAERDLMQRLNLPAERVRQVSGDDAVLEAHYRAATAFVFPSLYEGFGLPPLEAMSFDCPVICSGVSSIPEVVGDAAALFDPYEAEAMRGTIERLVGDDALRQSLILRGRERLRVFSWTRCARETLDVYGKVLA